ncbi:hypothetical protein BKA82DRAFT_2195183 [Pisolithus tinctorius]|nr:hypothetical protein BKA82DRAFT_2195183 [Pisolithus tinctorius]
MHAPMAYGSRALHSVITGMFPRNVCIKMGSRRMDEAKQVRAKENSNRNTMKMCQDITSLVSLAVLMSSLEIYISSLGVFLFIQSAVVLPDAVSHNKLATFFFWLLGCSTKDDFEGQVPAITFLVAEVPSYHGPCIRTLTKPAHSREGMIVFCGVFGLRGRLKSTQHQRCFLFNAAMTATLALHTLPKFAINWQRLTNVDIS